MKREDRKRLGGVIGELRHWLEIAGDVRFRSAHLPVTGHPELADGAPMLHALDKLEVSGDLDLARPMTRYSLFGSRSAQGPSSAAAERLLAFHAQVKNEEADFALLAYRDELGARAREEHSQLLAVLSQVGSLDSAAREALLDLQHMPVTRSGVISKAQREACETLVAEVETHLFRARRILDGENCTGGSCGSWHASARHLVSTFTAFRDSGADKLVRLAHTQSRGRLDSERAEVRKLADRAKRLESRARSTMGVRSASLEIVKKRADAMNKRGVNARLNGQSVTLIPLVDEDAEILPELGVLAGYQPTPADSAAMRGIRDDAATISRRLSDGFGFDWECRRDPTCVPLHDQTASLLTRVKEAEEQLRQLAPAAAVYVNGLDNLLDPRIEFAQWMAVTSDRLELMDAPLTARAKAGLQKIRYAGKEAKAAMSAVRAAADRIHAAEVVLALKAMDLEVLKKAADTSVRISALENAGLTTVYDVYQNAKAEYLVGLPGMGESTAIATEQAARRLYAAVREETPVRIDVKNRDAGSTALLEALRRWGVIRKFAPTDDEIEIATALLNAFKDHPTSKQVLCRHSGPGGSSPDVISALNDALARVGTLAVEGDVWTDFLSRPADYFGMLGELGYMTEDEKKMHGDLPDDIIEAVRELDLKREHLTASLRTYQSFGARFVLVQKKVVIGDEMGLGKTVEALAVFTHLRAMGRTHFLVVCPAAVVSNWMRETGKHTTLHPRRIHGPAGERKQALRQWMHRGGLAVTTFDLLTWVRGEMGRTDVSAAVFDEAHYIKNPKAKRSMAAAGLMDSVPYVMLMTGTPLENSVQEFRNLIGYIRPDLSETAPEYLASRFRKHVAPAYLRRNQEDVLTELPELVEVDDWVGMSETDETDYVSSVRESNFMKMRRVAMLSPKSMKMDRLLQIVAEAEENSRRVIVFSYFREVLDEVALRLPGMVFGPLTGSIAPRERQAMVDKFSAVSDGAVLVAQITAGGVGLNIQSASVVVICEPQLKPTMESQAIARAHRMGQTDTVQVHRLLTENSVDERIRELLADKRLIFDDFARDSVIAKRATDAVDVTDTEIARLVVAAERERLLGASAGG